MKKTLLRTLHARRQDGFASGDDTEPIGAAKSVNTAAPPPKPFTASYDYPCPAEVLQDRHVSDGAKLLMTVILGLSRREGFCWARNKFLADQIGKDKDSIPRLLKELAGELTEAKKNVGVVGTAYIIISGRQRRREIRVAGRFLRRNPGAVLHTSVASPSRESRRIAAYNKEKNTESHYKETPDSESLSSESLCIDSHYIDSHYVDTLASDSLHPAPHAFDTLASLTARFGAQFCHPDVVQAAEALGDLSGLPRYANIYRLDAGCDQDIWTEAVERTIIQWRAGSVEARTPRAYLEAAVKDVNEVRRRAEERRQRQAERDVLVVIRPTSKMDDAELDALMSIDPFADAPPTCSVPPPAPHPAVVQAVQTLRLGMPVEKLQAVFDGVCRGRESVFALAVSFMTREKANGKTLKFPIAIISRIAAEHSCKDEQWLRDRAAGHSTAECTARLAAFEEELEAVKQALNPHLSPIGSFHGDGMRSAADVIDAMIGEEGAASTHCDPTPTPGVPPTLAHVELPQTDREKESLEEEMSRSRDGWKALPRDLKNALEEAGKALANARATADTQEWEAWKKLGVYRSFQAHQQETERRERITAARNGSLASRADCGGDGDLSVDEDDGDDDYVP